MNAPSGFAAGATASAHLLREAAAILAAAGAARFVAETPLAPGGTVGRHVRHVIEFYENILAGLNSGQVDYARRVRDRRVEVELDYATARIEAVIAGLARAAGENPARPLEVRTEDGDPWCASTLEREMQAVTSHTVHHFALVAMILRALGYQPPDEFGVSASTLQFTKGPAH